MLTIVIFYNIYLNIASVFFKDDYQSVSVNDRGDDDIVGQGGGTGGAKSGSEMVNPTARGGGEFSNEKTESEVNMLN